MGKALLAGNLVRQAFAAKVQGVGHKSGNKEHQLCYNHQQRAVFIHNIRQCRRSSCRCYIAGNDLGSAFFVNGQQEVVQNAQQHIGQPRPDGQARFFNIAVAGDRVELAETRGARKVIENHGIAQDGVGFAPASGSQACFLIRKKLDYRIGKRVGGVLCCIIDACRYCQCE